MLLSKFRLYELNILKKLSFNHKDTSNFEKSIYKLCYIMDSTLILYKAIYSNSYRLFYFYRQIITEDESSHTEACTYSALIAYSIKYKSKNIFLLLQDEMIKLCDEDYYITEISEQMYPINNPEYVDLLKYKGDYDKALTTRIYYALEPNHKIFNPSLIGYYTALAHNLDNTIEFCDAFQLDRIKNIILKIRDE